MSPEKKHELAKRKIRRLIKAMEELKLENAALKVRMAKWGRPTNQERRSRVNPEANLRLDINTEQLTGGAR